MEQMLQHQSYDEVIFNLINNSKRSLSIETMSLLTGIPEYRICKVVNSLMKWRQIRPATSKRVTFYQPVRK